MKVASIIFLVLGILVNFAVSIWLAVISIVIGILAIYSLCEGCKKTVLGVLSIFFVSLLGGILYLCWNPEKNN